MEIDPPTRHVTTTRIVAVRGSSLEFRGDRVVGEEPLEIRAAGPGQDPVAVAVTNSPPATATGSVAVTECTGSTAVNVVNPR